MSVSSLREGSGVLLLSPACPWSQQVAVALSEASRQGSLHVYVSKWHKTTIERTGTGSKSYAGALTGNLADREDTLGGRVLPGFPEEYAEAVQKNNQPFKASKSAKPLQEEGQTPELTPYSVTVAIADAVLDKDGCFHFPETDDVRCQQAIEAYLKSARKYARVTDDGPLPQARDSTASVPSFITVEGSRSATVVADSASQILKGIADLNGEYAKQPRQSSVDQDTKEEVGESKDEMQRRRLASRWFDMDDSVATLGKDLQSLGQVKSQEDYHNILGKVFASFNRFEQSLNNSRFLNGKDISLADIQLYSLLVRVDPVFYHIFKANLCRIRDLPNLWQFTRDVYQTSKEAQLSTAWDYILHHYYRSYPLLNPNLTVPPLDIVPDLAAPSNREYFALEGDEEERRRVRERGTEELSSGARAGEFKRGQSKFRNTISDDSKDFRAESGRYHLYLANNCPWCHRVALTRSLKHLEPHISVNIVYYRRDPERGWQFKPDEPGCTHETETGISYISELYEKERSQEKSLPILYDKKTKRIVNNESRDIVRILGSAFDTLPGVNTKLKLFPSSLASRIDSAVSWIYTDIANGAYKAGFSSDQRAYEGAFEKFFSGLERLNDIFSRTRFVCGNVLTEADVLLFPPLFRFDMVYYIRMKLNKAMVRDYPYVQRWLLDMWSIPEVRRASNMRHAKAGYFGRTGNNIIPDGPLYPAKPDTLLYPAPDFACAAANSELQVKGSIIGNILDAVKGETSEGVGRADTFMPENRNEEVAKTRVPSRRGGGVGGTPSSGGVRGSDSVRDRTDSDHDRFQGGRRKRSSDSMSFGMFTVLSVGLVGAGLGVLVGRRFGGVRL